jgi:UDPglucose 6-dehydrogenase
VRAYDPAAIPKARAVLPDNNSLVYAADAYDAAAECDALLILTEWKEFASLDLHRVRSLLKHPIVIDGRNLYETTQMINAGLIYYSVGRSVGFPVHMSSLAYQAESGLHPSIPVERPAFSLQSSQQFNV